MKPLFLFLSIFCCHFLFAQIVNIEKSRIFDDSLGWSGSIDGGFNTVQNDKLLITSFLRPKVQYKSQKHYYLFLTDWSYSIGGKEVYANFGMAHFRYHYRLKYAPLKWESYTQIQYNQLLDQKGRALVGTGLRLKLLDTTHIRLFIGTSTLYEYEEIISTSEYINTFRWSNYFSWYFNAQRFSFTGINYIQPNWERFKDFRFLGQYAMYYKISKMIDLKLEVNTFFDAFPPPNVRNWVFNSHVGVKVNLRD